MNKNPRQGRSENHIQYEIKLKGHLEQHWSEWFDNLVIRYDENDNTTLTGPVTDQNALHGLLKKIRDLGLSLISVNEVEGNQEKEGNQNNT